LLTRFGESEANVRDVFDKAGAAAHCCASCCSTNLTRSPKPVVAHPAMRGVQVIQCSTILTEMDGMDAKKTILIIGTIYRPNPALLRPGRLKPIYIPIPLPDEKSRCPS